MEDRFPLPDQIQLAALPDGLVDGIAARIRMEEEYMKFRRAMMFVLCGLCLSIFGLMWSVGLLLTDMARSGFTSIASLALSDTGTVMAHWQDFGYSLLESLPVISVIIVLAALVAALHFCVRAWQQAKTAVRIFRFAHR